MGNLKRQIRIDITKCDEAIQSNNSKVAEELTEEIIHTYGNHINNIHAGVTLYSYSDINHIKDIRILKKKLEILVAEIMDGTFKPSTSKSNIILNNSSVNNNQNDNQNSLYVNVDLDILFKQAREDIINNDGLTDEDTNEIINRINDIEEIAYSDVSRKEKWSKLRGCISWLGTKGVDIGLKLLPIIIAILKNTK